jgi:predicted transcriptional regulator
VAGAIGKVTDEHYAYLLVEDEKWWNRRRDRSQRGSDRQAFVRRGKVGPKNAKVLLFYVKLPIGEIRGSAEFLERISGTADELWSLHGSETVFESTAEYDSFVGGRSNVTFIRLRNLQKSEKPTGWKNLSLALGIKKMPNGGMYLNRETADSIMNGAM